MDILSRTLLDLLRLAATPSDPNGSIVAAPMEDLLQICFGAALDSQDRAKLADGLRAITDGRSDMAVGLADLDTLIEPLRRRLGEDTGLSGQAARVAEALRDLLMIQHALQSEVQPQLTIQPTATIFQLLQQLRLRSQDGTAELILCAIAPTNQRLPIAFSKHPMLDRIKLTYQLSPIYPQLTISSPSLADIAPFAASRLDWQQKDSPEYRLELFNSRSLSLGTIATDMLAFPQSFECQRLRIVIPEHSTLHALQTAVFDRKQQLLARCIRIF